MAFVPLQVVPLVRISQEYCSKKPCAAGKSDAEQCLLLLLCSTRKPHYHHRPNNTPTLADCIFCLLALSLRSTMKNNEIICLLDDSDDDLEAASSVAKPVASRVLADGAIEILDSDDDDDDNTKKPAASSKKRAAVAKENDAPNPRFKQKKRKGSNADDEIAVLDALPQMKPAPAALPISNGNKNGDEIELVGSVGNNALTDFPHAREHCTLFPLGMDAVKHCAQCFCFVCDCAVADCGHWNQHCRATYSDPHWKRERERHAQQKKQQQQQQQQVATAASQQQQLARSTTTIVRTSTRARTSSSIGTPFRESPRPVVSPSRRSWTPSRASIRAKLPRPLPFARSCVTTRSRNCPSWWMSSSPADSSTCWKRDGIDTRGGWLCSEVGMVRLFGFC